MKIKVCGITREEDIVKLKELEVDFIGFNLLKESQRRVNIAWALDMTEKHQLGNKSVFLVDCEGPDFNKLKNKTTLNLQIYNFHEIPNVPNMLFIPVNATFLKQLEKPHFRIKENHRYLVDNMEGALGGTGEKFDWRILPKFNLSEVMIAGGIGAEDLNFLKNLNVWGIDVNSKFEFAPGKKNHDLLDSLRNTNE